MSPWDILGWIFVAFFGSVFGIMLALIFGAIIYIATEHIYQTRIKKILMAMKRYRKHLKTRHIEPGRGQFWDQQGSLFEITGVENGLVGIVSKSGGSTASFSDKIEDWHKRVAKRHMFLIRDADTFYESAL